MDNNDEAHANDHCCEDKANSAMQIMYKIVKSQKELGYKTNKLIGNKDIFDKIFEYSQRRWLELTKGNICCICYRRWIMGHLCEDMSLHCSKIVDENGGKLNTLNEVTIEYNLEFGKDEASRISNEHREEIIQTK
jgi:hypothetical protein